MLWILQRYALNLPLNLKEKLDLEFKEEKIINENLNESFIKISKFADILGFDEQKILNFSDKKENLFLIVGEDFYYSKNAKFLATLTESSRKAPSFRYGDIRL